MSAIWHDDGQGWFLLQPIGFTDEASLHDLIADAPHLLPLSGSPRLAVVGSRVTLGANQADVIAIEPDGRVVIIEVKLSRNAEARRAVVGQILSYAAFLRELSPEAFEHEVLDVHLRNRGFDNLAAAAAEADQEGAFSPQDFLEGLSRSLSSGAFRLVLVLDEAPEELARLISYLESVSDRLVIDLVAVSAYEVGGNRVLVPQRIDAERRGGARAPDTTVAPRGEVAGETTEGTDAFIQRISESGVEHQPQLLRLAHWARDLQAAGLARVRSYVTARRSSLLVWIPGEEAGLVTVWNDAGPYFSVWRSVFERRSPNSIPRVEEHLAPAPLGQGNGVRDISDDLLAALTDAYREAAPRIGRFDWSKALKAVEAMPDGTWTTYGDIAQFAGTSAVAVGQWAVSPQGPSKAYRVLAANGRPAPDFRWDDPEDRRDVRAVLKEAGVRFTDSGSADPSQRLGPSDLANLAVELK
jgi:alkylated DNA nucleotide flippase Atl1